MSKRALYWLLFWALVAPLILSACRRGREEPTPTPTAVAQATPTALPATATPTPAETPVAADWAPRVVASSPQPGQESLLDGAITLRFDQPMDQASVEAALSVTGGGQAVAGRVQWTRPDTVIFTPQSGLARAQDVTVRLADTARGVNGKPLQQALRLNFTTVGFLKVSQIIPAADGRDVATDSAVTVFFNRPVIPLTSTTEQVNLPAPLTLEPAVAGNGQWLSTSIYRFAPERPLDAGATYTVRIAEGLQDVTGAALEQPFSATFQTVRPKVVQTLPDLTAGPLDPTAPISVTFNMPMDPAAVEAAVSLAPAAPLRFTWSADGRTVGLTPVQRLALEQTYTLTIGSGAASRYGAATLERPYTARFNTWPFPKVVNTAPADGDVVEDYMVGYYSGVSISFASPMQRETLDGLIAITPAPDKVRYDFWSPDSVYLSFPFKYETTYTITVPGSAADRFGNTLGADYTFSFSTPKAPPLVSFNLPQPAAQLSTAFPSAVTLLTRNVAQTTVRFYNFNNQLPLQTLFETYRYDRTQTPTGLLWERTLTPSASPQALNVPLADGGVLPTGVYYLEATASELPRDSGWWQNQALLLVVAGTNLTIKETPAYVHIWATDLAGGRPVPNLPLTLYIYDSDAEGPRPTQVAQTRTDASGLATIEKTFAEDKPDYGYSYQYRYPLLAVAGNPGEPAFGLTTSGFNNSFAPWSLGVPTDVSWEPEESLVVFTDRPIYRPGDTVYIRGWVRTADYGRYELPFSRSISLQLSSYTSGDPVRLDLPLDETGGFSAQYVLPADQPLGTIAIGPVDANYGGAPYEEFMVAEFRKPELLVSVAPNRAEQLRGELLQFTVSADYFFGAPASDLPVSWTLYSDRVQPQWDGPYYSFGSADYTFYYDFSPEGYFGAWIASGEGRTDAQGNLIVTAPADVIAALAAGSRSITLEATVTDVNNTAVTANGQAVLHAAEVYVGVKPADYVSEVGRPAVVDLLTIDWRNNPVRNTPVEVVFLQREWVSSTRAGEFVWEPVDTEVARAQATTGAGGVGSASFAPAEGGAYVARATARDAAGRETTSETLFYIFGGLNFWRSDSRDRQMELIADKTLYQVGETAEVLVQTPFTEPHLAWLTVERGEVLEQSLIELTGAGDLLRIPIPAGYAPNVFVGVTAVKGVGAGDQQYPDIRSGVAELVVDPQQLVLNLTLRTEQTAYEPRDSVTYEITATDYAGNGVTADVALALVDLAILTLKPETTPPLVEAFYARQPLRSRVSGGLFISGEGLPVEFPGEPAGGMGGGGGDGRQESAFFDLEAARGEGQSDVRSDFRDTAYWEARVRTGPDGRATVTVTLPDNLTTWRMTARAVSDQTLVGDATHDITATRYLLIRPITPRFFTVGDRVLLGAVLNNNTDAALPTVATLEATGVTLLGDAAQTVTVPANGSAVVRWSVRVEDVPSVDLTFRAQSGPYADATKPTVGNNPDRLIPVYRYSAEDIVAAAGVLTDDEPRRVEAVLLPNLLDETRGALTVSLSPSLAAAVLETIEAHSMEPWQYDCVFGVVNRLAANAAALRAIDALNLDRPALRNQLDALIRAQLDRVVEAQMSDGGWSWCLGSRSDEMMTASALVALAYAREAGYEAPAATFRSGAVNLARASAAVKDAATANRQAFLIYARALAGGSVRPALAALWDDGRDLLDPYAKALLVLSFDDPADPTAVALLDDINQAAVLSATGAHWESNAGDYFNWNSDARGTAIVIQALVRAQPNSQLAANAVRWLMTARSGPYWATDYETTWSLMALTDWMRLTGELEASYDYQVYANRSLEADGSFGADNLTTTEQVAIPLSALEAADLNYLEFQKQGNGRLYYTAYLDAFISAEQLAPVDDRGFTIRRAYYDAACDPEQTACEPLTRFQAGQQVRVELTITASNNWNYVVISDPIPAGADAIDPNLATSGSRFGAGVQPGDTPYRFGYWGWWYFTRIQFLDEKVVFAADFLPAGTYQYTYYLQTVVPGDFQTPPTTAHLTFRAEVFGRSAGALFTIEE